MKINQSIVSALIVAGLTVPLLAIAADDESVNMDMIEYSNSEDVFTPCGVAQSDEEISFLPPPKEIKIGEVSYISGGVCVGGVEQMKSMAKNFPLEIVLVEKAEDKEKEGYIADVQVKINDAKDNLILDVSTEGPYLLVKLPDGLYLISAEYNDVIKTNQVKINSNKHERVVFLWSRRTVSE